MAPVDSNVSVLDSAKQQHAPVCESVITSDQSDHARKESPPANHEQAGHRRPVLFGPEKKPPALLRPAPPASGPAAPIAAGRSARVPSARPEPLPTRRVEAAGPRQSPALAPLAGNPLARSLEREPPDRHPSLPLSESALIRVCPYPSLPDRPATGRPAGEHQGCWGGGSHPPPARLAGLARDSDGHGGVAVLRDSDGAVTLSRRRHRLRRPTQPGEGPRPCRSGRAFGGAGDGRPNAMHCYSQAQAVC